MIQIQIDPEFAALIPPPGDDELRNLEQSLIDEGNRDPIVTWRGTVIDGHHRYDICTRLGIALKPPVEIDLPSRDHAKLWIKENQLSRRNLPDDRRAIVIDEIREERSRLAIAERSARANDVKYGRASLSANVSDKEEPRIDIRAEVAREHNLPVRKLKYAAILRREAPELAAKVRDGETTLIEAMRSVREASIVARFASLETRRAKELAGVYDVIVIDPPWPQAQLGYDERLDGDGMPLDYPTMAVDEIEREVGALVKRHAHDDCHVFLWTTMRFLPAALKMIEAWELRYVCNFTWHKPVGPQPLGLPCFNSEFVIYARRGAPAFVETKSFQTCFDAPRRGHSEKPEEFYATLRRVTAGRRLDMFNRRAIDGFETWGNEASDSAAEYIAITVEWNPDEIPDEALFDDAGDHGAALAAA